MKFSSRSTAWLTVFCAIAATLLACALPGNDATNPADAGATLDAAVQATVHAQQTAGATVRPSASPLPPTPTDQAPISVTLQYPTETPLPATNAPAPTDAPTAIPTAAPVNDFTRPNGQPVHAFHVTTAPVIDCTLSDWAALPDRIDQVTYRPENWTGASDNSADYNIAWDANNLYIGAHVTDDVHAQIALGELLFKGDSLELLFDSNLAGDFNDNVLSADDYQIGFTPGENKVGGPDAYLWFPKVKAGRPANTPVSGCEDTGQGFFLETAIPWATFGVTPAGGTKFGFVLSVSDNDTKGTTEQQSLISSVSTRKLTNPTTWGTLILDP